MPVAPVHQAPHYFVATVFSACHVLDCVDIEINDMIAVATVATIIFQRVT